MKHTKNIEQYQVVSSALSAVLTHCQHAATQHWKITTPANALLP